jgi:hypothetical protein
LALPASALYLAPGFTWGSLKFQILNPKLVPAHAGIINGNAAYCSDSFFRVAVGASGSAIIPYCFAASPLRNNNAPHSRPPEPTAILGKNFFSDSPASA